MRIGAAEATRGPPRVAAGQTYPGNYGAGIASERRLGPGTHTRADTQGSHDRKKESPSSEILTEAPGGHRKGTQSIGPQKADAALPQRQQRRQKRSAAPVAATPRRNPRQLLYDPEAARTGRRANAQSANLDKAGDEITSTDLMITASPLRQQSEIAARFSSYS